MQQQRTQERVQRRKAPQPTNRAAAPAQLPPLRRKQPQQNLPVVEFRHAKRLSRALEGVNRYLSAYGYPLPERLPAVAHGPFRYTDTCSPEMEIRIDEHDG